MEVKESADKLYSLNSFKKAAELYAEAIRKNPDPQFAKLCYGNRSACYLQMKDYKNAELDLGKALHGPINKKLYVRLLICKCRTGSFAAASQFIQGVPAEVACDPRFCVEVKRLHFNQKLFQMAQKLLKADKYQQAKMVMDTLERLQVQWPDLVCLRANYYTKLRDFKNASVLAKSVLEGDIRNVDAIYIMSECDFNSGDIESSFEGLQRLLRLDPDNTRGKSLYNQIKPMKMKLDDAREKFRNGLYSEALGLFRGLLVENQFWEYGHLRIAETLAKMNRHRDAISEYNIVLGKDPKSIEALLGKAKGLDKVGDYGEAYKFAKLLYESQRTPENLEFMQNAEGKLRQHANRNYHQSSASSVRDFHAIREYSKVLGLEMKFTKEDLTKAHRTLSKKYHPDKHPGKSEAEYRRLTRHCTKINEARDMILKQMKWH